MTIELSYYKNKNIIISGGTGFIGSLLAKRLKKIAKKLIILDSQTNIKDKKIWKALLKKTDILFHLAAQTSSKFSNDNPLLDMEINLLPVINIIDVCQKNKYLPDIIFAGTVTEIGLTEKIPVNEDFPDNPITIYDINKLTAEKYLQYYSNQMKGRAVSLRLANVYGPTLASGKADRGIVNLMIKKALNKENLTIYGKGNFIRDYIYIDDVVAAFLYAGIYIQNLKGKYYVIGSEKGHTIKEMVILIKNQVNKKIKTQIEIKYIPILQDLSSIEYRSFVADCSLFSKKSGWKPSISLKEGIKRTINYFGKKN